MFKSRIFSKSQMLVPWHNCMIATLRNSDRRHWISECVWIVLPVPNETKNKQQKDPPAANSFTMHSILVQHIRPKNLNKYVKTIHNQWNVPVTRSSESRQTFYKELYSNWQNRVSTASICFFSFREILPMLTDIVNWFTIKFQNVAPDFLTGSFESIRSSLVRLTLKWASKEIYIFQVFNLSSWPSSKEGRGEEDNSEFSCQSTANCIHG